MLTRRMALILVALMLLASCQDTALLIPELDTSRSNLVNTLSKGAVLGPGQGIPLSLTEQSDIDLIPDSVDITLRNQDGVSVANMVVPVEAKRTGPELPPSVPLGQGLATGKYSLDLIVKKGNDILERRSSSFFYSATTLVAQTIKVAPLSIEAGAWAVASLQMQGVEGANIRWTLHGKPLKLANYGSGGSTFVFTTPMQSGTYELLAELFPEVPTNQIGPDEKSSVFVRYSLVVSDEPAASKKTEYFSPRGAYSTLLLLEGSLRDWSFSENHVAWKGRSNLQYGLYHDYGGYTLGKDQYIESSLIPSLSGRLPATQSWDYLVALPKDGDGADSTVELMKVRGASGLDLIRFGLRNAGKPFFESRLPGLTGSWYSEKAIELEKNGPVHLRLAFIRAESGLRILLAVQGQRFAGFDLLAQDDVVFSEEQRPVSTILGNGGANFGLLGFAHANSALLAEALARSEPSVPILAWHQGAPARSLTLPKLAQGEKLRFGLSYSYEPYLGDLVIPLQAEFVDAAGTVLKVSTVKLVTAQGDAGVLYFDVELSKNILRFTIADRVQKVQSAEVPVLVKLSIPEIPPPALSDGYQILPIR